MNFFYREPRPESDRNGMGSDEAVAKAEPTTKDELKAVILTFWDKVLTTDLCNRYIDHVFKVAPVCVAEPQGIYLRNYFTRDHKGRVSVTSVSC